jgi:hypothetical protein
MAKSDWKDCEITLGSPDGTESLCIKIPILGQKHTNIKLIMSNAFKNAANLLKDADAVSSYSRIILCSLSCELFLKAIIIKTQNKITWGHDIYELYFELGDKERNQLLDAFLLRRIASDEDDIDLKISEGIDDFEKSLMLDAFLFETIRYKHEYGIIIYDENFIYNFAHDLKKLGEDLDLSE